MLFSPIILKRNFYRQFSNNQSPTQWPEAKWAKAALATGGFGSNHNKINKLLEIFIGLIDGDGYFDIGPQKQYSPNSKNHPKSTIRIRLGINLQAKDRELLEYIVTKIGVGKIDYSKSKDQHRLIFYQKDILNVIYPYIKSNNIEFLVYNRQKQFFLYNGK
jgi:hypothetical protein